jgi:hypothetical protein
VELLERVLHVRRSIGSYDDPKEMLTTKTEAGERLVPILDRAQAKHRMTAPHDLHVLLRNTRSPARKLRVFIRRG